MLSIQEFHINGKNIHTMVLTFLIGGANFVNKGYN